MSEREDNQAFCALPWLHLNLSPDGMTTLCCMSQAVLRDKDGRPLSAQTHSLKDIWASDAMRDIRRKMLAGEKVDFCRDCHRREADGVPSFRQFSNRKWLGALGGAMEDGRLSVSGVSEDALPLPKYLGIRVGNKCNLKCVICNPLYSDGIERDPVHSQWTTARPQKFASRFSEGRAWYEADRLIEEMIEISGDACEIQIAGGEPTVNRTYTKWLESLAASGQSKSIIIDFVTNMSYYNARIYDILPEFKKVTCKFSIDGVGKQYAYVRYPGKWEHIERNVERFKAMMGNTSTPITVDVMPVLSAYNFLDFDELYRWSIGHGFPMHASLVRGVPHLDCRILPLDVQREGSRRIRAFFEEASGPAAEASRPAAELCLEEIEQQNFDDARRRTDLEAFMRFTNDLDHSRKLSFADAFPELRRAIVDFVGDWTSALRHADAQTDDGASGLLAELSASSSASGFAPARLLKTGPGGWKAAEPAPQFLTLRFRRPVTLQAISLRATFFGPHGGVRDFTVTASDDEADWVRVFRGRHADMPALDTYALPRLGAWRVWRVTFEDAWGGDRTVALEELDWIVAPEDVGLPDAVAAGMAEALERSPVRGFLRDEGCRPLLDLAGAIVLRLEADELDTAAELLRGGIRQFAGDVEPWMRLPDPFRPYNDMEARVRFLQCMADALRGTLSAERIADVWERLLARKPRVGDRRALLLGEGHIWMQAGLADRAALRFEQALAIDSSCVLASHFQAEALRRLHPGGPPVVNNVAIDDLSDRFCHVPFADLIVGPFGAAWTCCPSWLTTPIGSLETTPDWRRIWNSSAMRAIRASIHDGSFRYCSRNCCGALLQNTLPRKRDVTDPVLRRYIDTKAVELDEGPRMINISIDNTCNLKCPQCRTDFIRTNPEQDRRIDAMIERSIVPMIEYSASEGCTILMSGDGEIFYSKHYLKILGSIDSSRMRKLRLRLQTNGLMVAKGWAQIPGIHDLVDTVGVSVDAASPEVYRKTRGASWEHLLENLKFIGLLRKSKKIKKFELHYAVQTDNFRDMATLAELAPTIGVDYIYFAKLRNNGGYSMDDYKSRCVFDDGHPLHGEWLAERAKPVLQQGHVVFGF